MADNTGIVARTLAGLRYAVTGTKPAEWFGPGLPLADQAPKDVKGRGWDFPVFTNTNYLPRRTEPVGFAKIKALATHCEPLKLVMARQRALMAAMEWTIKPKKSGTAKEDDPIIATITAFFEYPDKHHDWAQWLNALLDQVFVYDALSIYHRSTVGGELYALEIVDGSTISPIVDQWGRVPLAPDEGYQQVIKGLPAVKYTTEELLYFPENYRVDHIYGSSRVERIIVIVETMIAQMTSQLGYFTHGNIGDGFFTTPEGWATEQIFEFETLWNQKMSADGGARIADRRQAPWLPAGSAYVATKAELFTSGFEEWLVRLICFAFDVAPTPFLKQTGMGHSSAGTEKEAAQEGGVAQLMQMVRRLMNRLIASKFGRTDLEFSWSQDIELDPVAASKIQDEKLRNGSMFLDEARDLDGRPPIPDGLGSKPLIVTATGAVTLDSIINPPEPPAPIIMAPAPLGPDGKPVATKQPAVGAAAATKTEKPSKPSTAVPAPLAKAATDIEAKLARTITTFLKARAGEAATALADALGMEKAADEGPDPRIEKALDGIDWDWGALGTVTEPMIARLAVAAAIEAAGNLGLFDAATLKRVTARATAWAHERAAELVGMKWVGGELVANPNAEWSISENTRTMLRSSVSTAMEDGLSNSELAKAIRDDTAFSADRASMIARTETATADVQGSLAGYRASGLVEGKQWLASDGCCDLCGELDGVIVGLDEDFPGGGGDAPLHPNCECDILPVLPEDMPDAADEATGEE